MQDKINVHDDIMAKNNISKEANALLFSSSLHKKRK